MRAINRLRWHRKTARVVHTGVARLDLPFLGISLDRCAATAPVRRASIRVLRGSSSANALGRRSPRGSLWPRRGRERLSSPKLQGKL